MYKKLAAVKASITNSLSKIECLSNECINMASGCTEISNKVDGTLERQIEKQESWQKLKDKMHSVVDRNNKLVDRLYDIDLNQVEITKQIDDLSETIIGIHQNHDKQIIHDSILVKERQEQLKDISDACDKAALEEARLKLERDNNKSKMEVLTDQLKTVKEKICIREEEIAAKKIAFENEITDLKNKRQEKMEFWNSELLKKDIILQNKQDLNAKLEQEIQQIKKKAPKLLNEQLQRSSDAHQNEIAKIHAVFEELKSESLRKNFQEIETLKESLCKSNAILETEVKEKIKDNDQMESHLEKLKETNNLTHERTVNMKQELNDLIKNNKELEMQLSAITQKYEENTPNVFAKPQNPEIYKQNCNKNSTVSQQCQGFQDISYKQIKSQNLPGSSKQTLFKFTKKLTPHGTSQKSPYFSSQQYVKKMSTKDCLKTGIGNSTQLESKLISGLQTTKFSQVSPNNKQVFQSQHDCQLEVKENIIPVSPDHSNIGKRKTTSQQNNFTPSNSIKNPDEKKSNLSEISVIDIKPTSTDTKIARDESLQTKISSKSHDIPLDILHKSIDTQAAKIIQRNVRISTTSTKTFNTVCSTTYSTDETIKSMLLKPTHIDATSDDSDHEILE